jgi:hypothetical protein
LFSVGFLPLPSLFPPLLTRICFPFFRHDLEFSPKLLSGGRFAKLVWAGSCG